MRKFIKIIEENNNIRKLGGAVAAHVMRLGINSSRVVSATMEDKAQIHITFDNGDETFTLICDPCGIKKSDGSVQLFEDQTISEENVWEHIRGRGWNDPDSFITDDEEEAIFDAAVEATHQLNFLDERGSDFGFDDPEGMEWKANREDIRTSLKSWIEKKVDRISLDMYGTDSYSGPIVDSLYNDLLPKIEVELSKRGWQLTTK